MPEAKAQMEALLRQYPAGTVDIAYGTYDLETLGMAQAIEEAGRNEITVIGADGGDVLDWIARDSVVKATIVMDPKGAGRQAAINLVNYLRGQTLLPQETFWSSYICDTDNIEDFTQ
jgi:ABC-type sugar transport system substrate-binding protein